MRRKFDEPAHALRRPVRSRNPRAAPAAASATAFAHNHGRGPSREASRDCPCKGNRLAQHPPARGHDLAGHKRFPRRGLS